MPPISGRKRVFSARARGAREFTPGGAEGLEDRVEEEAAPGRGPGPGLGLFLARLGPRVRGSISALSLTGERCEGRDTRAAPPSGRGATRFIPRGCGGAGAWGGPRDEGREVEQEAAWQDGQATTRSFVSSVSVDLTYGVCCITVMAANERAREADDPRRHLHQSSLPRGGRTDAGGARRWRPPDGRSGSHRAPGGGRRGAVLTWSGGRARSAFWGGGWRRRGIFAAACSATSS